MKMKSKIHEMRSETDNSLPRDPLPIVSNDPKSNSLLLIPPRCISVEPFQEGNCMAQCSAKSVRCNRLVLIEAYLRTDEGSNEFCGKNE